MPGARKSSVLCVPICAHLRQDKQAGAPAGVGGSATGPGLHSVGVPGTPHVCASATVHCGRSVANLQGFPEPCIPLSHSKVANITLRARVSEERCSMFGGRESYRNTGVTWPVMAVLI